MPQHGPLGDPHGLGLSGNNPWIPYLDDDFGLAFNAFRPQRGPQSYLDYFRNSRGRVEQDFRTSNARLALSGQAPNLEPTDFLQNYDFTRRYLDQTPRQRGDFSIAPRLSFAGYRGR